MIAEGEWEDCRLQGFLKKAINSDMRYRFVLRRLANCCIYSDPSMGVHLVSNGKSSRVLGVRACLHSWACPYCSARKMSKYAARISAAIEALGTLCDLVPIMITFTVFHTNKYSCDEVFELLTRAYTMFDKMASIKKRKKSNGHLYANGGAWNKFCTEFNVVHKIKACEVTYGSQGWHPHLHNLYFVPRSRLQDVAEFEESLKDFWAQCVDKAAGVVFPDDRYEIRKFLEGKETRADYQHCGLYISKNADGSIRQMRSGDYACGYTYAHWGAEKELTGLACKVARDGHYTPMQMLQAAYDGNEELLEKYLEFASTVITRRQHRIDFSRTGIKHYIIQWRNTEGYKEYIKKKNTYVASQLVEKPYSLVAWFPSSLWLQICYENDFKSDWLIFLIKRFALYDEGYDLICELLAVFGFSPPCRSAPIDICTPFNDLIFSGRSYEEDEYYKERKAVALQAFSA